MKQGYSVFPSLMCSMKNLTKRATPLMHKLRANRLDVIEVHPASAREALGMPTKDWQKTRTFLKQIGLKGDLEIRTMTPHKIDAITAILIACLYS